MFTSKYQQQCTCCNTALSGGIDTFGDVDAPMCWSCWSSCMFDGEPFDPLEWREIFSTPDTPPAPDQEQGA